MFNTNKKITKLLSHFRKDQSVGLLSNHHYYFSKALSIRSYNLCCHHRHIKLKTRNIHNFSSKLFQQQTTTSSLSVRAFSQLNNNNLFLFGAFEKLKKFLFPNNKKQKMSQQQEETHMTLDKSMFNSGIDILAVKVQTKNISSLNKKLKGYV